MRLSRKSKGIDLRDVSPAIAEGLTQGPHSTEEANERFPVQKQVSGEQIVQQHLGGKQSFIGRLPVFRALLRDDTDSVWTDGATDRLQRNVIASVDPETFRSMQAGHMCLRCYEPQPNAFPEQCDLCGYSMAERQIMDIAMEFKGIEHVGPAQPFSEFIAQQEERMARAAFDKKIADGGSRGRRRG